MVADRPTASLRRRRLRAVSIGAIVAAGIMAVALALGWVGVPAGAPQEEQLGFAGSTETTFPDCAVVEVHWVVPTGGPVAFVYGQSAEEVQPSDCHGSYSVPSANCTCPPSYCPPGRASAGPGPICYQEGTSGTSYFLATQPDGYTFSTANPNGTAGTPADLPLVDLTWNVSAPLVPPSELGTLALGIAAAALVALITASRAARAR